MRYELKHSDKKHDKLIFINLEDISSASLVKTLVADDKSVVEYTMSFAGENSEFELKDNQKNSALPKQFDEIVAFLANLKENLYWNRYKWIDANIETEFLIDLSKIEFLGIDYRKEIGFDCLEIAIGKNKGVFTINDKHGQGVQDIYNDIKSRLEAKK